ncbi:flavodoxin domain-containing protein [Deinococcus detaillensis]|nr:flavodoxin domain-containing protein [Deinococcus detaillensis]
MLDQRILVAYASHTGSTEEAVGTALQEHGARVDVHPVQDVTTLKPYRTVLVGSAIHAAKWLPEAAEFVKRHTTELEQLPLSYFLVCATFREDTAEHHREVLAYLDPVRVLLEPLEIGLFAGRLDASRLPLLERMLVKAMKSGEGDWRDWEAIHDWAGGVWEHLEHGEGEAVA